MVPNILVFDEAISDFDNLKSLVEATELGDITYTDGRLYRRVALRDDWRDPFTILATTYTGLPLRARVVAIRENGPENTTKDGWIHSDAGIGDFASVLWITDPPPGVQDGTKFWKHRATGAEFNPESEYIPDEYLPDLSDESKWDEAGFISAKANRLLVYPTSRFHSRWPATGWQTEDGKRRTIVVAFYDLVTE